jgi:hypothetical protein
MLRTAAGDDDRVGDEIEVPVDQVATDCRHLLERSIGCRNISRRWTACAEVVEEPGKRLLSGTKEDRVGMGRCFVGQRGDVQPSERDERAPSTVMIGKRVCPSRAGDVDLNHHQVRTIVEPETRDMFVLDRCCIVRLQVRGERGEPERRKQRILDWSPVGTARFGQGRENELDAQWPHELFHETCIYFVLQS